MLKIFLLFLALLPLPAFSSIDEAELSNVQPPTQPMVVNTGFYLLNLVSLNERDQTFTADVYFVFTWNDPRLQFEGDQEHPHIFSEDAAKTRLETMWWPNPEFINTGEPEVTNRTLYVYPDGKVEYTLGITANFRGAFDYRKFPFDSQKLEIKMSSFVWDRNWMDFKVNPQDIGFSKSDNTAFEERNVSNVTVDIREESRGYENDVYSVYSVNILIDRNPSFYLYQVLVPCFIVLIISYCVFFIDPKEFANRLIVGLTCILVFIATKFTVNLDLPRVNYITVIDKIFFLFYFCAGFTIIVSLIDRILMSRPNPPTWSLDKIARRLIPVFFILVFLTFFLTQKG
jgi:Neurotransmitter-gated ion-channel ligand binding domain